MASAQSFGPTLLAIGLLLLLTVGVLSLAGIPHRWAPVSAIGRGVLQLAVLSFVLSGVIRSPILVLAALVLMFSVAVITATRRLGWSLHHLLLTAAAMASGIAVVTSVVFATGALDLGARYALALGGIVIGNSMTIVSLAGRRFTEAVHDDWERVEGWFAIGATPRQATRQLARRTVYSALIPSIDQTRTTGLVTLPGAFVGAIFGGASPVEAGRFQMIVLASILAAGAITAVIVVTSLAPMRQRPNPTE